MRFRRKGTDVPEESEEQPPEEQSGTPAGSGDAPTAGQAVPDEAGDVPGAGADEAHHSSSSAGGSAAPWGPHDAEDVSGDGVDRFDLGALLLAETPGKEIRLQVHEETQEVQSVLIAGQDGALELKPFAAPRGEDLWAEVRPQLSADVAQRGGTATEEDGPFGPELSCHLPAQDQEGQSVVQTSRILGINGPRWLLRATLIGTPATEREQAEEWEALLAQVVVRRGTEPRGSGDPLPLAVPPEARPQQEE